jgi:hypothetical protein
LVINSELRIEAVAPGADSVEFILDDSILENVPNPGYDEFSCSFGVSTGLYFCEAVAYKDHESKDTDFVTIYYINI